MRRDNLATSDSFDDAVDYEDVVDESKTLSKAPDQHLEVDGDGYMSCDSAEQVTDAHQDDEEFNKQWDAESDSWYYVSAKTGDSFWAVAQAEEWMEVPDKQSRVTYHRHSITGETKWADEPITVWEELKDPITQQHYYYSNVSKSSQWTLPTWLDLIDPASGVVYYFNAETNESVWEQPEDFVATAVDDSQEGEMDYLLDPMGSAYQGSVTATPTPRTTPAPHYKQWLDENAEPSKRPASDQIEVSVAYSLSKRPRAVQRAAVPLKNEAPPASIEDQSSSRSEKSQHDVTSPERHSIILETINTGTGSPVDAHKALSGRVPFEERSAPFEERSASVTMPPPPPQSSYSSMGKQDEATG